MDLSLDACLLTLLIYYKSVQPDWITLEVKQLQLGETESVW